jgi:hypothetical protein
MQAIRWPDGKKFAFSVFDDTDASTVENAPRVYSLLRDLGFRTTKSVWPCAGLREPSVVGGSTCAEPDYLAWVKELQKEGFEIGLHNITYHSSTREETARGLERFVELFGHEPRAMATHTSCQEGLYWGSARVTGAHRVLYDVLNRGKQMGWFRGHIEGDRFFWGDLAQKRVQYLRNFTLPDMNTLKVCPWMPYYDPGRPWVRAWFASSEGARCKNYTDTISEAAQDRLEHEGGACIMYTHFGKGFYKDGALDSRFVTLMTRLSKKNGWFVPTSTLLDYIKQQRGGIHTLTKRERRRLERRWLIHKIQHGST